MSKEIIVFEGKDCRLIRRDGQLFYVNKTTGQELVVIRSDRFSITQSRSMR